MSFLKKLWDKIVGIIKKVIDAIKKYLPILILLVVLFWPVLAPMLASWLPAGMTAFGSSLIASGTWVGTLSALQLGALALGASFLLAPDETADMVGNVSEHIGEAISSVVSNVGGGVLDGITGAIFGEGTSFGSVLLVGAAGYLAYSLITSEDGSETQPSTDEVDATTYDGTEEIPLETGDTLTWSYDDENEDLF